MSKASSESLSLELEDSQLSRFPRAPAAERRAVAGFTPWLHSSYEDLLRPFGHVL